MEKERVPENIYLCFIDYAKAFDCVDHNKLWKILQEMGILDHLTYLLRNLYAGQEATVRSGHGTTDWFQIEKGVCQGCILSPCLFNLYAVYIMRNPGLEETQLESRLLEEISITSDIQMTEHNPLPRTTRQISVRAKENYSRSLGPKNGYCFSLKRL